MNARTLFQTAPVTTLLIASFVALFAWQVLTGVDANNPSIQDLLNWGANALPLSMGHEPWRLLASGFLHIGLLHLLFNAFAMYFFGQVAEVMFGSVKFLMLFLLSVLGGNLLNNYLGWQSALDGVPPAISAGASGGIMGIGGALLLASLLRFSVHGMILNQKSLLLVMGANILMGFAIPNIDNAGHIGGAVTGAILGLAFVVGYRLSLPKALSQDSAIPHHSIQHTGSSPRPIGFMLPWLVIAVCVVGFVMLWYDIHQQLLIYI